MPPEATPTAFGRLTKHDFAFFGWHIAMNANLEKIDSELETLFLRETAPAFAWTDQFFDTDLAATPTQVLVNDTPAVRFPDGAESEAGGLLLVPVGTPTTSLVSVRIKLATPAPGAGTIDFDVTTRINGGSESAVLPVSITPPTSANIREVRELFKFGPYELNEEDDVVIKLRRKGATDSFGGAADLVALSMTPVTA